MSGTIHPCKGTVLKLGTGGVEVAVAQVIELDIGAQQPEVFDADTLDNPVAGIRKLPTGRTDNEAITGTFFYHPTYHAPLAVFSQNPGTYTQVDASKTITGSIEMPNGVATLTFTAATVAIGTSTVRMNDGWKTGFTITPSGNVLYPES